MSAGSGTFCDMMTWPLQVPAFADEARVILIDLPGHGQSDKPKIEYNMDLLAGAVDAVHKEAGVEKSVLVGPRGDRLNSSIVWVTVVVAPSGSLAPKSTSLSTTYPRPGSAQKAPGIGAVRLAVTDRCA